MTLRGSVASFPLETIVQLLAATAKTGQLEVRSGSDSGTLGFAEGRLVSAVSGDDAGDAALGAVFTISEGDFEFVPWGDPPNANLAGDLNHLLDRAVVQRDKIASDRQLISDDGVSFVLSERAAAQGEVRLSAEQWRALLAVNGERDLSAIAAQMRLGRLATLAMLADLVRAGIIEVRGGPTEPPSSDPGSGPGGGGSEGAGSFTSGAAVADWDRPRSEMVTWPAAAPVTEPAPPPAPEAERPAMPDPEPATAAAWEEPPPIPPREVRAWDTPAADATPAPPASEPSTWDVPAMDTTAPADVRTWDAPAADTTAAPGTDAPFDQSTSWQTPAAPTEQRDWGLPAQDWEKAASAPREWAPAPAPEAAPEPAATSEVVDERLSALSGLFGPPAGAPAAPPPAWAPPVETLRDATPAPAIQPEPEAAPAAPAAPEVKKKGGLFSGLFKKEEAREAAPAAETGSRATTLASFANALLDEFNNGGYGKGRLDDRIANLLMRVDEQADPIDRPLPILNDRIDVLALERAKMSERQVAPYLALLVSQIYQDAEHAFGRDKAKRGYKSVQTAVVGDPATLGTDLRLPKV